MPNVFMNSLISSVEYNGLHVAEHRSELLRQPLLRYEAW